MFKNARKLIQEKAETNAAAELKKKKGSKKQREAPSNTQYQTEIPHSIPSTVELEWNLKLNNIVNKFVTTTME